MKLTCKNNHGGYEAVFTNGKEYEIVDIQHGIFAGDYYVIAIGDDDKPHAGFHYRFDITKDDARKITESKYGTYAENEARQQQEQ